MNKLFGFFKQKITQVKQENKQQLQIIAQAISQTEYSREKVMQLLHNGKSNYMSWNILIANEASTGLYYSQVHNRNICLRKIKGNDEMEKEIEKNKMKLKYFKQMHQELKEITQLSNEWVSKINTDANQLLYRVQKQKQREKHKLKMEEREQEQEKQKQKQHNEIEKQGQALVEQADEIKQQITI